MSKIEWTQKTWNPLAGCLIRSAGCRNCYAMKMAARCEAMGQAKYKGTTRRVGGHVVWTGRINLDERALRGPLDRRPPTTWFVNSMSDLFFGDDHDRLVCGRTGEPFSPVPFEFVDRVFAVMALSPQHTFQVLTKRPARMREYLSTAGSPLDRDRWDVVSEVAQHMGKIVWDPRGSDLFAYGPGARITQAEADRRRRAPAWPLPNVWIGTSVENQACADERIPELLATPAAVRFISAEPLLGPVDLTAIRVPLGGESYMTRSALEGTDGLNRGAETPGRDRRLDWVIAGGESGPGSRACRTGWVRSLVRQCAAAGVPCFVKQLGARPETVLGGQLTPDGTRSFPLKLLSPKGGDPAEWPEDLRVRQMPERK